MILCIKCIKNNLVKKQNNKKHRYLPVFFLIQEVRITQLQNQGKISVNTGKNKTEILQKNCLQNASFACIIFWQK